ncbi:enoyl-CoA delta isomerase 2-like [Phymastichus coffea]|uniref:enoyl-CoA delta isomerase 2-like n=1 Tax=Phymastichus coffea TaxID=108790 RepID=UPI00273CC754|nr:enoyl-CoA delta isomerase 2-like [Phymastichus coffea]
MDAFARARSRICPSSREATITDFRALFFSLLFSFFARRVSRSLSESRDDDSLMKMQASPRPVARAPLFRDLGARPNSADVEYPVVSQSSACCPDPSSQPAVRSSSSSMSSLDQRLEEAAEAVKSLTRRPTDQELLELYALYKQASVGDVNTSRPAMFDLKGKAKWDAWNSKKGMSRDEAKELYIEYVNTLLDKYKE